MRRSGICSAASVATVASVALLLTAGCFYGFAGGGLPSHVKTIAVIPFENETTSSEIQRELVDALRAELHRRLGVREAPEARANAIVRGKIQRYEVDIPVAYSADNRATTTALRMLEIVVDIEVLDQVTGETLWERKGLLVDAKYEERGEPAARKEAIGRVINALVEGAQSQW